MSVVTCAWAAYRGGLPLIPKLRYADRHARATEMSTISPSALSGLRVLVIDDHPDTLALLAAVLELCGAQIVAAGTARQALELLARVVPDVLVSDIAMPEEDGYSFIRKVRALPPERGGRVPALAFTGFGHEYSRAHSLAAGFQEHLIKTSGPAALVAAIARLAHR